MRDESRFYGEMLYRKKIFILLDFGIIIVMYEYLNIGNIFILLCQV